MVRSRVIEKAEAQITRTQKVRGVRKLRMAQFDEYVVPLKNFPEEAIVYEELDEPGQSFVLSLRAALKRHGFANAVVRKMRSRDEVRVWLSDEPRARRARRSPESVVTSANGRGQRKRG